MKINENIQNEHILDVYSHNPLSYSQQRLWFLEKIYPESTSYNNTHLLKMEGNLNIKNLNKSLSLIFKKHEVLRSRIYETDDGHAYTHVLPFEKIELKVEDLSNRSNTKLVESVIENVANTPFHINRDPLIKLKLLKLSPDKHTLIITVHHIIWDSWSIKLFFKELQNFYNSLSNNEIPKYEELLYQFHECAAKQKQWVEAGEYKDQLVYWKFFLQEVPTKLQFPFRSLNSFTPEKSGQVVNFTLSNEFIENINVISRKNKSTNFMTLFSVFSILLRKYTNQQDLIIGTPIANRNNEEIEDVIGFFTNTLPVRVKLNDSNSFSDLLKANRKNLLNCYEHQDIPFEKIVEETKVDRSQDYMPLVQVSFVYHKASNRKISLKGLTSNITDVEVSNSKFDLSLILTEANEGLKCQLRYNAYIINEEIITNMIHDFKHILKTITKNSSAIIENLLITEEEYKEIVFANNDSDIIFESTKLLHNKFEEQAKFTPESIAITDENGQYSYEEVNKKANKISHYLRKNKVLPGSSVGMMVDHSINSIAGILGILKAGCVYVPIDLATPEERVKFILDEAEIKVLMRPKETINLFKTNCQEIYIDENKEIDRSSDQNLEMLINPESIAYIIFTSGSTGNAKGVMIKHSSVVDLAEGLNFKIFTKNYEDKAVKNFALNASLAFDASVQQLVSICYGNNIYLIPEHIKYEPLKLLKYINNYKIDVFDCTPTQLRLLINEGLLEGNSKYPQTVLVGGEPIDEKLWNEIRVSKNIQFYNMYGPTECTVDVTYCHINNSLPIPNIGKPLPNNRIYILNENLKPVPKGVTGEIYIGGKGVAKGYLKNFELTSEKFIISSFQNEEDSTLYKTGDMGYFLPDGSIRFTGRNDNQIKISGYRVELEEVTSQINSVTSVISSICLLQRSENGQDELVAYLEIQENFNLLGLREELSKTLPYYMVPNKFFKVEEWPITINGKIDKKKLSANKSEITEDRSFTTLTQTQEIIKNIWSKLLKNDDININENFFNLGGHSLLITQMMSNINKMFNINISIHSLFEKPTILGISILVEKLRSDEGTKENYQPIPKNELSNKKIPLSFAQKRIWFSENLNSDQAVFNMPVFFEMHGKLNRTLLKTSVNRIIKRHDSLRTVFIREEDEIFQLIKEDLEIDLEVINFEDLSSLTPLNLIDKKIMEIMNNESKKPFSLDKGPLIKISLIKFSEIKHILLINMHHIISDAWSLEIFMNELSRYYNEEDLLPDLSIQYADFSIWEKNQLKKIEMKKQMKYWQEKLEGELPVLKLPFDKPYPNLKTNNGARETIIFNTELTKKFNSFCKEQGMTSYMTFLAAYNLLLGKYTGQKDIIVGSPIAGRNREEVEGLIGFFINTIILRSNLVEEMNFLDFLKEVRTDTLNAFSNQDIPFDLLVEKLNPDRHLGYSPIAQVMLTVQNTPKKDWKIKGIKTKELFRKLAISKYPLNLKISEVGKELSLSFEYNTDLFNSETIQNMLKHFRNLLEEIINTPNKKISEFIMFDEDEFENITKKWNDTIEYYNSESNLVRLFEKQVEQSPDAPAVVFGNQSLTYSELNNRANRLAYYLKKGKSTTPKAIGIYLERGIESIVSQLAILKLGCAYVPLDPSYPDNRISYMIENSNLQSVITLEKYQNNLSLPNLVVYLIDKEQSLICQESSENFATTSMAKDLAYIIYTSGSTGKPKGVMVPHENVVNLVNWQKAQYDLHEGRKVTHLSNPAFDASVWEIYPTLCAGATLYIVEEEKKIVPEDLKTWLLEKEINVSFIPTPLIEPLVELKWPKRHSLNFVLTGGDQLRISKEIQLPFTLVNHYGPTETTVLATAGVVKSKDRASIFSDIGKPISNTQTYVLDESLNITPVGVTGELYIGGAGVTLGYMENDELTHKHFVSNPFTSDKESRLYKTGDLVKYLPDGRIHFVGRSDNQVSVRGYRVELGEIEIPLKEHPLVKDVLVINEKNQNQVIENRLIAFLLVESKDLNIKEDIYKLLAKKLPSFMIPSSIVVLNEFPYTPNGKVDKKALLKLQTQEKQPLENFNLMETKIKKIWKEILGISTIAPDDNFFEVGGHSLLLAKLLGRIEDEFDVSVPLREVFETPTINGMAKKIKHFIQNEEQDILFKKISNIWKEVLGISTIAPDDNFFEVGGHSLLLAKLLGKIEDEFDVSVPLREVFETPTMNGMAKKIKHFIQNEEQDILFKKVSNIWKEVLGISTIAPDDNFFEVGGHSLLLAKLLGKIEDEFNVNVPIRDFFETPTLLAITDKLAKSISEIKINTSLISYKENRESFTASYGQVRFWFLDKMLSKKSVNNSPLILNLSGNLDPVALSNSVEQVINRHESLRTTFVEHNTDVLQVISSETSFDLPVHDVSILEEGALAQNYLELLETEIHHSFDLEKGPLIRACLIRKTSQDHVLLVNMHHAITDGWSMDIFVRELNAFYEKHTAGKSLDLPELPIQYGDYATWQKDWLKEKVLANQLAYWKEQLRGELPVLQLPMDRQRPAKQTFNGNKQSIVISTELVQALKALNQKAGTTSFMTLLAAFKVLLHRYSGQNDLLVGTPISNRNKQEIENLIGFFVNTLVIRTEINEDFSFMELLKQVRETALEAYTHQDVPFERVVEEIQPARSLSHSPLFQTMFSYHNTSGAEMKIGDLEVQQLQVQSKIAKHDLTLVVDESLNNTIISLSYNTDLFNEETIDRMLTSFHLILQDVVEKPEALIGDIEILSKEENDRIVQEWNRTEDEYPSSDTLHQLFEKQVEQSPDAPAVIFGNQSLTYSELNNRANRLAAHLKENGVKVDSLIGVIMHRSIETMVSLMAILKAGAAYVPINPSFPEDRINFIINEADLNLILIHNETKSVTLNEKGKILNVSTLNLDLHKNQDSNLEIVVDSNNLAYVIYTSGSTGTPKGVMIEHKSVVNKLTWQQKKYPIDKDDAILQKTSFSFDVSVWELFWPLLHGAKLVFLAPHGEKNPKEIIKTIKEEKITKLHFVPSMLTPFLQFLKERELRFLDSINQVFVGGEAINKNQVDLFKKLLPHVKLTNSYGPTEATIGVSFYDLTDNYNEYNSIPIGKPISNTELYILNKNHKIQPVGVIGELHIGGVGLSRGYLNRIELTKEKFIKNPYKKGESLYKTGDLVRYISDGNIEFLGRNDSQVKIRGYRIELAEIENVLIDHPEIEQAIGVVIGKDSISMKIGMYIKFISSERKITDDLRSFLTKKLPSYMIPEVFQVIEKIPLNSSGKIDKSAFPKFLLDNNFEGENYNAPSSPLEENITEIWSDVIGIKRVGIDDNFFLIGGHSLFALQVMSRINNIYSTDIPLEAIFENQTPRLLSNLILKEILKIIKKM
ncbi:non-ribosomal peptide synthetase [Psychrobacillus glaciei]|uniref:non-ribosomal peptide synthetase n=1 Tax=Psychrobacillus glaciei TaxID=2283160 RepID=UPI00178C6624|nr:non-ribosomal peptide synthetase [Psychrobacillus glaciei]